MFKRLLATQDCTKRLFLVKNKTQINECITQILKLNEKQADNSLEQPPSQNSGAGNDLNHIYWST